MLQYLERKKKKWERRRKGYGKTYQVENKTNQYFEDGMKQMWVEIKRDTGQTSRRGRHGNSHLKSTER